MVGTLLSSVDFQGAVGPLPNIGDCADLSLPVAVGDEGEVREFPLSSTIMKLSASDGGVLLAMYSKWSGVVV